MPHHDTTDTWLYAIGARDDDLTKIGISLDPRRRAMALSAAQGRNVEVLAKSLLGLRDVARDAERALHDHFADHRTRGEWFRAPREEIVAAVLLAADEQWQRAHGVGESRRVLERVLTVTGRGGARTPRLRPPRPAPRLYCLAQAADLLPIPFLEAKQWLMDQGLVHGGLVNWDHVLAAVPPSTRPAPRSGDLRGPAAGDGPKLGGGA